MKNILTFLLIFSFTTPLLAGGPWTQNRNEGIFIANISPVIYKTYSSSTSDRLDMWRRVSQVSTQGYFEVGLTDELLLLGNLVLNYAGTSTKTFDTDDFIALLPPGRIFGMGNSTIGLKYRFTKKSNFQFAISFQVEFPGTTEEPATGLRTGYDAWTFVPMAHFGQGFSSGVYYFVEGGFAGHTKISHEYRLHGEVGYQFRKPLVLAFAVNVKESLKNKLTADNLNYRQTGLYLNNQEFISWTFNFTYEIRENIGWNIALAGGFRTELIARTPVISSGMYFKWNNKSYSEED